MKPKVQIQLTEEQLTQLKPLFDKADERPKEGIILGQAWESFYWQHDGYVVFEWCEPEEIIRRVKKAAAQALP